MLITDHDYDKTCDQSEKRVGPVDMIMMPLLVMTMRMMMTRRREVRGGEGGGGEGEGGGRQAGAGKPASLFHLLLGGNMYSHV